MADRIDALVEQLGNAALKVNGIEKSIADMSKRLDAGFAGVDVAASALARYTEFAFERLEATIIASTTQLEEKISASANELEEKMSASATELEAKISSRLEAKMDGGFTRLERKLDRLIGGDSEPS